MNPSPAIGNTKSGNNAGDALLWAAGSTETMYYVHKDYASATLSTGLGSISAITDATGNLLESLSYDACSVKLGFCEHSETKALVEPISLQEMQREGRRRKATNWADYNVTSTMFDRGFTGHEHLPHFGLINMNGRVYDPFLARFLSPDPFVQAPSYSQNYNRYSYAWNNPLKYTDPSGYYLINGQYRENSQDVFYQDGGSFSPNPSNFTNNMYISTGRIGPGSGNHWSDAYRSEYGNFMLGSSGSFDRMYGQGASAYYIGYYTGENTRYVWNPVAGNEVSREWGKGFVNVYYSGDWVRASPFTGPSFGGSVPMYSNALTDGPGAANGGGDGPSRIRLFMDYTIMVPFDLLGGTYDFAKNYYDMRKLNLINSDKYFHAKANFQATRRGPGGAFIAIRLSNLREIIDQRIKGDSWFDSMEDQRANIYGRRLGWEYRYFEGTIDYSEILKTYRYDYFPEGY
jgi:RHS repeat-associated protein